MMDLDNSSLVPKYSEVETVDLSTQITPKIKLQLPALVYIHENSRNAIQLARKGALGIIEHGRDLEIIKRIHREQSPVIINPITVSPETSIAEGIRLVISEDISSLVVVEEKKVVGLITRNVLLAAPRNGLIKDYCVPLANLVMGSPQITQKEVEATFQQFRISHLPIVDTETKELRGLATAKNLLNRAMFPNNKKLLAIAEILAYNEKRIKDLMNLGVETFYISGARHHKEYGDLIEKIKALAPESEIIVDGVYTLDCLRFFRAAGADCVVIGGGIKNGAIGVPTMKVLEECAVETDFFILVENLKKETQYGKALATGLKAVVIRDLDFLDKCFIENKIKWLKEIIEDICIHVGANNLKELREKAEWA
jgi:IMP dehydrogenase